MATATKGATGFTGDPVAAGLQAADTAGKKWGVPSWVLFGIYGMETDFGRNVTTSSAGAEGPMQFLPSTWAKYGKGGDVNNLPQSMDAAGHYLHDLLQQHGGNVDAAVRAYSGGGYGQSQVKSKGNQGLDAATKGVGSVASNALGNPLSTIGDFLSAITNPQTWIRLFEAIGGAVLLAMALKELTGQSVGGLPRRLARAAV